MIDRRMNKQNGKEKNNKAEKIKGNRNRIKRNIKK